MKRGSSGADNAGLEPYSEFYAGQIIRSVISFTEFRFEKHPKYNLPDSRLEALEKIIRRQAEEILKFGK